MFWNESSSQVSRVRPHPGMKGVFTRCLAPQKLGPSEQSSFCPPILLTCGSSLRLSPGTSGMRSLSLFLLPEKQWSQPLSLRAWLSPLHLTPAWSQVYYLSPRISVPTLQLASFQSLHYRSSVGAAPKPSLILDSFSFPPSSISPETSANISFHLSPCHTWPLLYALNWCHWDNIWRY